MSTIYEHVLTGERYEGTLKRAWRALCLPYSVATCADGRQILFNASRKPLWQRTGKTPPAAIGPRASLPPGIYDDLVYWPGMSDRDANAAACAVLVAWGIPVPAPADVLRAVCRP